MALMIQRINGGRLAPLIFCDACKREIRGEGQGVMVYSWPGEADGESKDAFFAHKGACHDQLEQRCEPDSGTAPWQELSHFFTNLLHNTGIPIEILAAEQAERISLGRPTLNDL